MVNEEKLFEVLTSLQSDMASMKGDITSMKGDITSMKGDITSLQSDMASVKEDVVKINIKLETDIEVKIDALGEGHAAILERLVPRTRVDELENEVRFLKTVVFQMSEDIQLLKKAQ